jgi:hypothetical protein
MQAIRIAKRRPPGERPSTTVLPLDPATTT